ncbi:hypothetical protein P7K49_023832, partial [Saguinus oedipus]
MATQPVTPPTANAPTLAPTPQPTAASRVHSHSELESRGGREEQWGAPRAEWETQTTPRRWDSGALEERGGGVVPASKLALSSTTPQPCRQAPSYRRKTEASQAQLVLTPTSANFLCP